MKTTTITALVIGGFAGLACVDRPDEELPAEPQVSRQADAGDPVPIALPRRLIGPQRIALNRPLPPYPVPGSPNYPQGGNGMVPLPINTIECQYWHSEWRDDCLYDSFWCQYFSGPPPDPDEGPDIPVIWTPEECACCFGEPNPDCPSCEDFGL